jgi:hypothetical protein
VIAADYPRRRDHTGRVDAIEQKAFVRFGPRVSEEGGSDVPATRAADGSE